MFIYFELIFLFWAIYPKEITRIWENAFSNKSKNVTPTHLEHKHIIGNFLIEILPIIVFFLKVFKNVALYCYENFIRDSGSVIFRAAQYIPF